jgi:hypothetical protein
MPKQAPVASGVPSASAAPQQLTARNIASLLGRNQGPELFFQQQFIPLQSPVINKNINLTRPLERLHLIWKGRVTITGENYDVIAAEAPQSIIQRIRLTGTHKVFNALVPFDMSGATAFAYPRLFKSRSCSAYINGVRQLEPNVPFFQVGSTFGNVGIYDMEIHYDIPLGPILQPSSKLNATAFMFMEDDWSDTLQLQLFFGDETSYGTPGGSTVVAFSAFGSNAGSPLVTILTNYEILGPLGSQIEGAVVIRNEQTLTAPVAAAGQNIQLTLLQKQKTLNVLLKSGILLTGTSAGVSVFASLTDQMLEQTQITVDNKPVKNNFLNAAMKEYTGFAFNTVQPEGYLVESFDEASQQPLTYYRGDLVAGGSTFAVLSQVLTAEENQAVNFVQEQVFGTPGGQQATQASSAPASAAASTS